MTTAVPPDLVATDAYRRRAALERLATSTQPLERPVIAAVVGCLAIPEKSVQRLAADLLRDVEPELRPEVAAELRAAMAAPDPCWRWGATWALGRLGVFEPPMIEPLLEALGAVDGDQRWAAAELLTTCARIHPELVLTALLAAAADALSERRKMVLYVLRDVAPTHVGVRAVTRRGLGDPAVGVRFAALAALARLEPRPPDAATLVLALARTDPDPGLRRAALTTLGAIGRGVREVEREIAAASTSDDPATRRAAAIARRRLGA